MDWETFQTAYQAADEKNKSIVDSTVIPDCVAKLVETNKIETAHRKALIQGISLLILDGAKKKEVVTMLKKIPVPSAETILPELMTDIKAAPLKSSSVDIADEIQEAETVLKSIPAIRTMVQDMNNSVGDEPIYTTTQEAILKEGKKEAPANPPTLRESHQRN